VDSLRRWWGSLWRRTARTATAQPSATDPDTAAASRGGVLGIEDDAGRPAPSRRRYTAPPADDDPQREAHLGAVLQALDGRSLTRADLGARVGAANWGSGRLDAVVAYGVGTGVLVETADGAVTARYAD
jgi:hypothetical protein